MAVDTAPSSTACDRVAPLVDSGRLKTWKKIFFSFFLVLGLAGCGVIPYFVGVRETLNTITQVGWTCVGGYVLLCSVVVIMPAIGWWIMMRAEGIPVTLSQTMKAAIMGAPLNFFFPSAHLGGDPVKMVYIASVADVTKRRVLATIVASKMQELAALTVGMVACAFYFVLTKKQFLTPVQTALMLSGVGLLGVLLLLLFAGFIFNWNPTVKLVRFIGRLGIARKTMERLEPWATDMERIVHATLVHRWKSSLVAQLVVSISALSILYRPFYFVRFLADPPTMTMSDSSMLYVIINFLNTVSFIPGGLGLMEGGIVGYFAAAGLGKVNGLAFQILNRISDAVQVTLGLWLIAHYGMTSVARGVATGTETIQERDLREAAEAEEKSGITHPPKRLE